MNNKYKLHNFRVFDKKGAEFEIAPITILTGCNSSGKSSLAKSMILLDEFFKKMISDYIHKRNFDIRNYGLTFDEGRHNLVSFSNTLSNLSRENEIIFSYSKFSNFLFSEVEVKISFGQNKKDFFRNAIINSIQILKDGEEIFSVKMANKYEIHINGNAIKKEFFQFVKRVDKYDQLARYLEHDKGIEFARGFDFYEDYRGYTGEDYEAIESVLKAKANIISRDDVYLLFHSIKDINQDANMLFYLPILEKVGDCTKENISENIYSIFEQLLEKEENQQDYFSEGIKKLRGGIIEIINDFIQSDSLTFKDYFLQLENSHLEEVQTFKNSISLNDTNTFLSLILEDYLTYDMPPWRSEMLYAYTAIDYHERNHPSKFMLHYFYFAILCTYIDPEFRDQRLKEYADSGMGWMEYIELKEVRVFKQFLTAFLQECLFIPPSFISNLTFMEAVRANMHRVYNFSDKSSSFNGIIKKFIQVTQRTNENETSYKPKDFFKKWLRKFEIADDIEFNVIQHGFVEIFLKRKNSNILLADEGFGITQLLPILLQIEINILESTGVYLHPFVKNINHKINNSSILIEEPETNLHPKFQSLFAEMMCDAYKNYNIHFILETHSEYLIRKTQYLVAKKEISSEDVKIYYFYKPKMVPKGENQVKCIEVRKDGILKQDFGEGFFDESIRLTRDLLNLQNSN